MTNWSGVCSDSGLTSLNLFSVVKLYRVIRLPSFTCRTVVRISIGHPDYIRRVLKGRVLFQPLLWPGLWLAEFEPSGSGSHQPSFFLLRLLKSLPTRCLPVPAFSEYLSKLSPLFYPTSDVLSQYLSPASPFLLLPASELELIIMLAPSSLILLINAGKLLPIIISKAILGLIHFKSLQSIRFIFIRICMCIPDESPINVTARKDLPSSYRFT